MGLVHIMPLLWLALTLFTAIVASISSLQPSPPQQFDYYTPNSYPDSLHDWTLCGGMPEPSLICDPNHLLNSTDDEIPGSLKLHRALQYIRQTTNCSCTNQHQLPQGSSNNNDCLTGDKARGYTISIGVLKKIQIDAREDVLIEKSTEELIGDDGTNYYTKEGLMQRFTDALRKRLYRGQCEDDVLIVLSTDDNAVWTSTGYVAAKKINPSFVRDVSTRALNDYFNNKDYTTGLLYIVNEYASQLGSPIKGYTQYFHPPTWFDTHLWSHLPSTWSESPWRWWILVGVVLIVLAMLFLLVMAVAWAVKQLYRRVRHQRAGYTPGHQQQRNGNNNK